MVSSCITVMYPEKESDMSFSSEVKEELAKHISPARHCQIAELAALMNFSGQYGRSAEGAGRVSGSAGGKIRCEP